jgi:hypothetical protein
MKTALTISAACNLVLVALLVTVWQCYRTVSERVRVEFEDSPLSEFSQQETAILLKTRPVIDQYLKHPAQCYVSSIERRGEEILIGVNTLTWLAQPNCTLVVDGEPVRFYIREPLRTDQAPPYFRFDRDLHFLGTWPEGSNRVSGSD